ncbi:MAG TPA: carboxypeptidase regulatory-like domain-containing protein [Gemmatimonadaceae bacterium]|nr:carboxypeptidase regulatory-like domain-containing protein [Gemmatimonadaceae bacterium]
MGGFTRHWTRVVAVAALGCAPFPAAHAQLLPSTLVGMVRDSSGVPIPGVEVRYHGTDFLSVRTNDSGGFRMINLPVGAANVSVRRMGFSPSNVDVRLRPGRTDSLVFTLTALATTIAGVLVEDEYEARSRRLLAGFWERRSRGFGYFLTRDEIEKRAAHEFVDLARMVPSVTIGVRNGRKTIRFSRSSTSRDCPPQYVVDGMRIENGSPDEFTPQDIEAIELYSGPATIPPQFAPRFNSYTCGAVVIWTRLPGA